MKKAKITNEEILNKILSNSRITSNVLSSIELPESILEEWVEYFTLYQIIRNQKVSEKFVEKFQHVFDSSCWELISEKPEYLTKNFILQNINNLDLNNVFYHTTIWFPELVEKYATFIQENDLKGYNNKFFPKLYLEFEDIFQNIKKEKIYDLMIENFETKEKIQIICQALNNTEFKEMLKFWESTSYYFKDKLTVYLDCITSDKQQVLKQYICESKKNIDILFKIVCLQTDMIVIEQELDNLIEQGHQIPDNIFNSLNCENVNLKFIKKYNFSKRAKLYYALKKNLTLEELEQNIELFAPYWRYGILKNNQISNSLPSKLKTKYRNYISQNNILQYR